MQRSVFRFGLISLLCLLALGVVTYLTITVWNWSSPGAQALTTQAVEANVTPSPTNTAVPLSYPWSTPAALPTTVLCWKIGNNHAGTLEACVINDRTQPLAIQPLSEQRVKEILDIAGFHCLDDGGLSWLCAEAISVARCESQLYVVASGNRRQAYGLFQLTTDQMAWVNENFGLGFGNLFDPVQNAQIAYLLWNAQGWEAWPACQP